MPDPTQSDALRKLRTSFDPVNRELQTLELYQPPQRLADSLDLVFLVDTTESIGAGLAAVSATLQGVANSIAGNYERVRYAIVTFKDEDQTEILTNGFVNLASLTSSLSTLTLGSGGGEYGGFYTCILSHLPKVGQEPMTGAYWENFWEFTPGPSGQTQRIWLEPEPPTYSFGDMVVFNDSAFPAGIDVVQWPTPGGGPLRFSVCIVGMDVINDGDGFDGSYGEVSQSLNWKLVTPYTVIGGSSILLNQHTSDGGQIYRCILAHGSSTIFPGVGIYWELVETNDKGNWAYPYYLAGDVITGDELENGFGAVRMACKDLVWDYEADRVVVLTSDAGSHSRGATLLAAKNALVGKQIRFVHNHLAATGSIAGYESLIDATQGAKVNNGTIGQIVSAMKGLLQGSPPPVYLVNDSQPLTASLENGAQKTFENRSFALNPFTSGEDGALSISLTLDNTDFAVSRYLAKAKKFAIPLEVTLRVYLSDDVMSPQNNPPLRLFATDFETKGSTVSCQVRWLDLTNATFPNAFYTTQRCPSLE